MKKQIKEFDGGFSERVEGSSKEIGDYLKRFSFLNLNELLEYSNKLAMTDKVRRIHRMAIKARKLELADRIEEKYRDYFPKDDMIMAMQYALMAQQKLKDNEKGKKQKRQL